ncbi:preprotein translocase SecE subunit [Bacilli bacterium PM5-3]|nr:preprotein translocase SecE subunit [Bacilli bacterium PM5-3]MDH6603395.1 preprotein translocase SecE subunit [Bacilli bacterium PM5-9]
MSKISKYFKSVYAEAKRVEWPSGSKLKSMTLTVLGVSAVFGVIFFIMDIVINGIMGAMGI